MKTRRTKRLLVGSLVVLCALTLSACVTPRWFKEGYVAAYDSMFPTNSVKADTR